MDMTDIEKKKAELREESQRVNEVTARVRSETELAKRTLASLEAGLPKLLALFQLGRVPRSELTKTKKRIRELRQWLEDYPLLTLGLADHLTTLSTRGNQISLLEKQIRRYETLKTELQKRHRTDLENELLGLAHELTCLGDAKTFLNSISRQ
jgi:hypothetical protein